MTSLATPPLRFIRESVKMEEEVWETTLQGVKSYGAYGPRDVLIIRSNESLEGPDVVPRREGTLTAEDKDRLTNEGIKEEAWSDDVKLMEARYRKEMQRFPQQPQANVEHT